MKDTMMGITNKYYVMVLLKGAPFDEVHPLEMLSFMALLSYIR